LYTCGIGIGGSVGVGGIGGSVGDGIGGSGVGIGGVGGGVGDGGAGDGGGTIGSGWSGSSGAGSVMCAPYPIGTAPNPTRQSSHSSKTAPPPTAYRWPMSDGPVSKRPPIVLAPGAGRRYEMGRMRADFKADGAETAEGYSISEWSLEANTTGPGAHAHPEDDVFYVVEGTMSFLVEDEWIAAPRGTFVLVPGGTTHDFQNRSDAPATALNLSFPGGFEPHMPSIVEWFEQRPPGDAT
jgi:quercetin dioxygenase-like cupin family protein